MKKIELTKGAVAFVDDADYSLVKDHEWYATIIGSRCYATRRAYSPERRMIYMHREIIGAGEGMDVDHIVHRPLIADNRRSNLRVCTRSENLRNSRARKTPTKLSRYKGVSFDKRDLRWCAYIQVDGRKKSLGYFSDEIAAARAYDVAAKKYFGEFALTNFR